MAGGEASDHEVVHGELSSDDLALLAQADAKGSRIAILRRIVEQHQYEKIDGYLVDATTAQLLVKCYESLDRPGGLFERKPEQRAKFDEVPLAKLVDLAWSVAS